MIKYKNVGKNIGAAEAIFSDGKVDEQLYLRIKEHWHQGDAGYFRKAHRKNGGIDYVSHRTSVKM